MKRRFASEKEKKVKNFSFEITSYERPFASLITAFSPLQVTTCVENRALKERSLKNANRAEMPFFLKNINNDDNFFQRNAFFLID